MGVISVSQLVSENLLVCRQSHTERVMLVPVEAAF